MNIPTTAPAPDLRLKAIFAALLIGLSAAVALTTTTSNADARLSWCFGDPIVEIAGEEVAINVLFPIENLGALENPVDVVVHVPAGVTTGVLEMNTPYFTERVTFIEEPGWAWESGEPVRVEVEVLVRASESFRVKVEVEYDRPNGKEHTIVRMGKSNAWVTTTLRVGK
jgi:hypothetical protein